MTSNVKYLSTSWKLLNQDGKKWMLHVFVLALLQLIPVVGFIAACGYVYTWTTRTAWGMKTSPCKMGNKSQMFSFGAKLFLVFLIWTIASQVILQLVFVVLTAIPIIGIVVSLLSLPLGIACSIFVLVCVQRAAIYDDVLAGFSVPQIFDMCSRDWNGLFKIGVMYFLLSIPAFIIAVVFIVAPLLAGLLPLLMTVDGPTDFVNLLFRTIFTMSVPIIIGVILSTIASVVSTLLVCNSVAVWMAQFFPSCWGSRSEYIPINPAPVEQYVQPDQVEHDDFLQVENSDPQSVQAPRVPNCDQDESSDNK